MSGRTATYALWLLFAIVAFAIVLELVQPVLEASSGVP